MLCLNGEDITLVASTNHPLKMWIVHILTSEWPQCNCPIEQGIICKHVMKIFKMLHLNILDDAVIRETSTLHGVQKGLTLDAHINYVDMFDQKVSVNEKPEGVTTFKTTKEDEAYITSNLGKLIDHIFT
jgi:hypothetical protein